MTAAVRWREAPCWRQWRNTTGNSSVQAMVSFGDAEADAIAAETANIRFAVRQSARWAVSQPVGLTPYPLKRANIAPCGSLRTAKRPVPGMSVGSTMTVAPRSAAFLASASTSVAPK